MKLPIAAEGCCAGHGCDDCRTCQRGRCCRRDNPEYRLPKLGDWDGPIYGELGVVARPDGDKAECHICGESFHHVTIHAAWIHDVTAEEYRALFGLTVRDSMVSLSNANRLSRRAKDGNMAERLQGLDPRHGLTPEQWSAYVKQYIATDEARRVVLGKPPRYSRERIFPLLHSRGHRIATDEEREDIVRLRSAGVPPAECARRYGISIRTVRKIFAASRIVGR